MERLGSVVVPPSGAPAKVGSTGCVGGSKSWNRPSSGNKGGFSKYVQKNTAPKPSVNPSDKPSKSIGSGGSSDSGSESKDSKYTGRRREGKDRKGARFVPKSAASKKDTEIGEEFQKLAGERDGLQEAIDNLSEEAQEKFYDSENDYKLMTENLRHKRYYEEEVDSIIRPVHKVLEDDLDSELWRDEAKQLDFTMTEDKGWEPWALLAKHAFYAAVGFSSLNIIAKGLNYFLSSPGLIGSSVNLFGFFKSILIPPRRIIFNTLLSGIGLVCSDRARLYYGIPTVYNRFIKHTYKSVVEDMEDEETTDLRPDHLSMGNLRHDANVCPVIYTRRELFAVSKVILYPSLELVSQITNLSNVSLVIDPKVVFERLTFQAKGIQSINLNRYKHLANFNIENDSVLVAYALYLKMISDRRLVPLKRAPA
jgi:hypothetical protein